MAALVGSRFSCLALRLANSVYRRSLAVPGLRLTLDNLEWLLETSATIRQLECTLRIPRQTSSLDHITQGLDTVFARLTSLEHLHLSLKFEPRNWEEEVTDLIMAHIARLSHLRTLVLAGDFRFAQSDVTPSADRPCFAATLSSLNITHLTLRCWSLFEEFIAEEDRDDLATVLGGSTDAFPRLQSLSILYGSEEWISIDLPGAAEDRGIELRLCALD